MIAIWQPHVRPFCATDSAVQSSALQAELLHTKQNERLPMAGARLSLQVGASFVASRKWRRADCILSLLFALWHAVLSSAHSSPKSSSQCPAFPQVNGCGPGQSNRPTGHQTPFLGAAGSFYFEFVRPTPDLSHAPKSSCLSGALKRRRGGEGGEGGEKTVRGALPSPRTGAGSLDLICGRFFFICFPLSQPSTSFPPFPPALPTPCLPWPRVSLFSSLHALPFLPFSLLFAREGPVSSPACRARHLSCALFPLGEPFLRHLLS
jgi:hypothetical protein